MPIKQSLNKLQIPFHNKTRVSLVGLLVPYIRFRRIFYKTAPDTFWLIRLPCNQAPATGADTV